MQRMLRQHIFPELKIIEKSSCSYAGYFLHYFIYREWNWHLNEKILPTNEFLLNIKRDLEYSKDFLRLLNSNSKN